MREWDELAEFDGSWRRTAHCGELSGSDAGREVTIGGWVSAVRDHGGLLFLDVRDRWGVVQVVVSPDSDQLSLAHQLRLDFVVGIRGTVALRPDGFANPNLTTGDIELHVRDLAVFNRAAPSPLGEGLDDVDEALRLRYRYIDLRRDALRRNLALRHRAAESVRSYLTSQGCWEIETPYLTRSTPEGARDYLVPSRISPGSVYALAQSPQLFKQLLMVSGYERYFQLVRCFRDEDLRADRQPEFTQIDIELSFVDAEDVLGLTEGMISAVWRDVLGIDLDTPFPRMTWQDAMSRYGSDKPDLRYGLAISDLGPAFSHGRIGVFSRAISAGGGVYGITVPGMAGLSRREIDELAAVAVSAGASGLATFAVLADELKSPLAKFLTDEDRTSLIAAAGARTGDMVAVAAGPWRQTVIALGALRRELARRLGLSRSGEFAFGWVTDFPLLEWDDDRQRFDAVHHPFTAPLGSDLDMLGTDPGAVRANAYDLVLNGVELGGGSIRIHRREVQQRVFRSLGLDERQAEAKFGFLLRALEAGAPPHGGVALGFDRIVMMLAGASNIRDVIPFPKTTRAACLMTDAPAPAEPEQLAELGLVLQPRVQAGDTGDPGSEPSNQDEG